MPGTLRLLGDDDHELAYEEALEKAAATKAAEQQQAVERDAELIRLAVEKERAEVQERAAKGAAYVTRLAELGIKVTLYERNPQLTVGDQVQKEHSKRVGRIIKDNGRVRGENGQLLDNRYMVQFEEGEEGLLWCSESMLKTPGTTTVYEAQLMLNEALYPSDDVEKKQTGQSGNRSASNMQAKPKAKPNAKPKPSRPRMGRSGTCAACRKKAKMWKIKCQRGCTFGVCSGCKHTPKFPKTKSCNNTRPCPTCNKKSPMWKLVSW